MTKRSHVNGSSDAGPTQRTYDADVSRTLAWVAGLIALVFLLFMLEASVGHDGLLCELGYDKDGDGTGVTGCG